ncbi:MAG: type III pantothenate kinase [Bacteroidales bacterium]|jgi:type III pantothenate kinase|nr:type III pantothenate kinase [Bacteroidales bacterium]
MINKEIRYIVDEGNSLVKMAAYQGENWLFFNSSEMFSDTFLINFLNKIEAKNDRSEKPKLIFSSVRKDVTSQLQLLSLYFHVLHFTHQTDIPIVNLYETPETLGKDRLAAVIGAAGIFPQKNSLVIDAGTCITYDFIDREQKYLGGGVMPGLLMNLKALHTFTDNLPLISLGLASSLCGKNTTEAILAGSVNAIVLGLDAVIDQFRQMYPALKVILCGGDAKLLHNNLKNDTFAELKLVLYGLKQILDFNEDS